MCRVFDVLSLSPSSTHVRGVDGELTSILILPASLKLFAPVYYTPLRIIQTQVRSGLCKYHVDEVPGSERLPEDPAAGDLDVHAADVAREEDLNLSHLTDGLYWIIPPPFLLI